MNHDRIMRRALQLTTVFNLVAAFALAFPASALGQLMGLPPAAPPIYLAMASGAVALFGFAYGWLSVQRIIDRPLVVLSAVAKLMAFASVVVIALLGDMPMRSIVMVSPDLAFAAIFIWWLRGA
jgi:nitrate reductase gamma subunit